MTNIALAKEELMIIQSVSNSKKTFVVRKGKAEGVLINQESLFTSDKFSLSARVIEVTRDYSLWQLSDTRATVPFQKGETVNYTNTIENLYTEIPLLRYDPKELAKEAREKNKIAELRPEKWLLRGNLSYTLAESVTDIAGDLESSRSGVNLEAQYLWSLTPKMSIGAGLRYDQENTSITDPNLDIPTTRVFVTGDYIYHFDYIGESRDHIYMAIGIGLGQSSTDVDGTISSGVATLLPSVRIGYQLALSSGVSMIVESVAEAISANESFEDGTSQRTNLVNAKLAIGLKF